MILEYHSDLVMTEFACAESFHRLGLSTPTASKFETPYVQTRPIMLSNLTTDSHFYRYR